MTLIDLFKNWCAVNGFFPEPITYVRDPTPLHPQCARLIRMHSRSDEGMGHEQHYILEARFGASDIIFPLGQGRRDVIAMEAALRGELELTKLTGI